MSFRSFRGGLALALLLSGAAAVAAAAEVQLFDANLQYTSGVVLPLRSYDAAGIEPLTTPAWTAAARPIARAAADGASLLVVRIPLAASDTGSVRVSLVSDLSDADPGSLWTIPDARVVDTSAQGGAIDAAGIIGARTITVESLLVGAQRFAFVLYRAPRNFDNGAGTTGTLASRTLRLTAQTTSSSDTKTITVVRPLVVFIHGTSADNDAWLPFPLWHDSANEVHGFTGGTLPFHATRISFNWIWNATGGVLENAATILSQLATALKDWREATGTAATQADVVTHSFGGFIARQVVQTQPDANPLSLRTQQNFRAAANWGHGSIHKLITLAATHRGAASANATAYLNAKGSLPGFGREAACQTGSYIDRGALRDQMVLSDALRALGETRVPGHAVAGSGRAILDPSNSYRELFTVLPFTDKSDGPYAKAANNKCSLDALANYIFNLDANIPPWTGSDADGNCSVTPNYDLVVSELSSLGLMTGGAATTAADLGLAGVLNHSAIHDPAFGSPAIVKAVSDRVQFLLEQQTTGPSFSRFPAVASAPPSAVEKTLTDTFDPSWLEFGQRCPAPVYVTTCPTYTSLQAVPSRLRLEDSTPAPISVYGLLNGEWVLANSPTTSSSTSRDCPITLKSSDTSVAAISANDVTGAQTVVAAGAGSASITVSVKGASDLTVPVTVTSGLGSAGVCAADATTLCLNGGRFKVQATWTGPDGRGGAGQATRLTADAGDFWFFMSDNIELVVKIVDGRSVNAHFWLFAGGLTNVAVTLTVTDTVSGAARTYTNPQGKAFAPIQDLAAFESAPESKLQGLRSKVADLAGPDFRPSTLDLRPASADAEASPCVADSTTLCLNNARFSVRTQWTTPDGGSGFGRAVALTGDTGDFWFFSPNNVEVVVKALNGCGINSRYWTFAAGLTNVNVVMTVTDTRTGLARTYTNPQGKPFQPIQDTSSFATCP